MKNSIFLFLVLVMLATTSCKKDDSNDGGTSRFSVTIAGEALDVEGFWAYAADFDDHVNIYGVTGEGTGKTCYVSIPAGTVPGTYTFDADNYYAVFTDDDQSAYATYWGNGSGSVTVTEIDAEHVKGSFQFTAISSASNDVSVTATGGEFDVEFR